ncbi:hypothetical protein CLNEO_05940 [Anaerotignum neopropionicum]|uniref:Uncharacterized protein n=1 Tax=Anaerotignum neopropionicum TaxID=36847 RepID=A0A136WIT9_9FIRM|nr:hypothetical protein [Anaerotignum neopropionicum]KXL54488.1 hypothetical protein CLNEO_05940 [Anaerotignum neopropionicum]
MNALKEKFANIEVKPNAKTMEEVVAYIEEQWKAQRVKIKESEYVAHYKNAMEFMRQMGKSTEGVQEEIRRYALPNKICVVLGMKSEYMTAENGMKYYQALTLIKGLTQEDIDTQNDRWLQYMILLDMQKDWDVKEAEYKAYMAAEKAEGQA